MENHIFFLKYTKQLPTEFFELSNSMSRYGVKLVPIRAQELSAMMNSKKVFVISLDNSMKVHRDVLIHRKQFLDYAILNRRLVMFDISSFSKMGMAYRAERYNNYFHFSLPDTISEITKEIAVAYFKDRRESSLWPGGRRAKIPSI